MKYLVVAYLLFAFVVSSAIGQNTDTLPAISDGKAPGNFAEMWDGFDPQAEPLDVETFHEWEEHGVVLRIVRFHIGVFKGQRAKLAAVYGYPKERSGQKLPGLVQIHGGGQYADYKACLANAKRGYATVSIAWAGRISAPNYRVTPKEVKLFWDGKTDDPAYRVTTDWGAVDGYHAPGRNPRNNFPSAMPADWTLDTVESPRNSGWFLCAVAARRAITFLEQQPEVDPKCIGVYGHSMGGKLTVLAAVDSRVKVAAPSCGGVSDRYNDSPLFRATLGDDVSLKKISCPIIFLSPANDFHGRIGDLPSTIKEISGEWRVTCSPHHNHQDTPPYEVATLLWFDQHLKNSFVFPKTPTTKLTLQSSDGVPTIAVTPDSTRPVLSVDVYYTQDGIPNETPQVRENTMTRFWRHTPAVNSNGNWSAKLPVASDNNPLWCYANVTYELDQPVSGAGYYYGSYTAETFNVSSLLDQVSPKQLSAAGVKATLKPSRLIEEFADDWQKEWFTYKPENWGRSTFKLRDNVFAAPAGSQLALDVKSAEPNTMVILLDDFFAEVPINGGDDWQQIKLTPQSFHDISGTALADWKAVRKLTLSETERLRPKRGTDTKTKVIGGRWKGAAPQFRNLRWDEGQ